MTAMSTQTRHLARHLRRFARAQDGSQLVEFAILLPMLLLVFAVIVEGGRMMWSFQAANAGVRDATRYLARVVPSDICASGGSVAGWKTKVEDIVRKTSAGDAFFPTGITVTSVTPSLACHAEEIYRVPVVGVAQVTARVSIAFPFAGVFRFALGNDAAAGSTIVTTVTDRSRIFGT